MVFVERLGGIGVGSHLVYLNVWDSQAGEDGPRVWQIDVYLNPHLPNQTPDMIIYLSQTQVEMLKLDEGDDDWWTNPESFLFMYGNNMPRKVRRILENLEV
jgi:hypothetical protein